MRRFEVWVPIREFVDFDHGEGCDEACEGEGVEPDVDVRSGSLLLSRVGGLQD